MAKPDAYARPDGLEIRKARKINNLSPEELAEKAEVGVSTVKRAERGLRVQLRNLSKIAHALNMRLDTIAPELRNVQNIQVLSQWGLEFDLIAKANNSIVIVDSYFSEYGRLGAALRTRSAALKGQANQHSLSIEIYMASPDREYGAQRLREMTDIEILRSTEDAPTLLSNKLTESAKEHYGSYFCTLEKNIKSAANAYADSIKIFEYFCLPGLRVVAIDNSHYLFGWFPLFLGNPGHTCFYLKDENLVGADALLLNEIRVQINNVRAASKPRGNLSNLSEES